MFLRQNDLLKLLILCALYPKTNCSKGNGSPIRTSKKLALSKEPGFSLTQEEMIKFKIWPFGIIPYYIDDFSYDLVLQQRIDNYLKSIGDISSLRFVKLHLPPNNSNERWVFFINRRAILECVDYTTKNFTNEGVQRVILGYDCLSAPKALGATILALVGITAMHNAPDRDNYIYVQKDNIVPGKYELFEAVNNTDWLFHSIPYDFLSAGHYNFHKYTYNGSATIVPQIAISVPVGENDGFTYKDVLKIGMLYNYISKKKLPSVDVCSKLYKPSRNFHRLKNELYKPRKKSNKYLEVPDMKYIKTPIGYFYDKYKLGTLRPHDIKHIFEELSDWATSVESPR